MSRAERDLILAETDPAEWLDQHGDYLYAYALAKVRQTEAAEDLVQETLMTAIATRDRFEGRSSLRTWLVGILKHKVADHLRVAQRRRASSRTPPARASEQEVEQWVEGQFARSGKWKAPPGTWGADPSALPEHEEFCEVLSRCVEKLPAKASEALIMAECRGLKADKLSNLLGITKTHLGVLLYRARSAMRRCLEAHWFGRRSQGDSRGV